MFMPRDYRKDPSFNHYYVREDLKRKPRAPFPVGVLSLGDIVDREDSFLGIGHVTGCVETSSGTVPVIELRDVEDQQTYTLLGTECSWTYPPAREMTDAVMDDRLAISSVRHYIDTLSEARDIAWLDGIGIDPASI
jgi:hypothetical protein